MASQHAPPYNFPLDMSPDNSPIVGIPGLPLVPSGSVSPSITSRSMPHNELLTPPPIIRPLFIDNLVKDLINLDASHRARLLAFVKLGSIGMDSTCSQSCLWMKLKDAALPLLMVSETSAVYADLKVRLEDTFMLTSEQKLSIRAIAQDTIYQANRISFISMHLDIEKTLQTDQGSMNMANIYNIPAREKILMSMVKRIASSVHNAFRQDIRDSITGSDTVSLDQFTWDTATKYKRGGPGEKLDIGFTIHNVLLRRFALNNLSLLGAEETADDDNDGVTEPSTNKRKCSGGRVPKGQDFWSQVDQFFVREVKARGRQLTGNGWREYVDDSIRRDNTLFGGADSTEAILASSSMEGILNFYNQPGPSVHVSDLAASV